jgi:hypothetical protein
MYIRLLGHYNISQVSALSEKLISGSVCQCYVYVSLERYIIAVGGIRYIINGNPELLITGQLANYF